MPLAAHEPLGAVIAVRAADLGRLDRLAVDAAGRRGRLAPGPPADLRAQGVVDRPPGAIARPSGEIVVDGPPGREVAREGPPRAAVPVAVEDRVDHLAEVGLAGPAVDPGGREVGFDDAPSGVGQVAGIGFGSHPLPTF